MVNKAILIGRLGQDPEIKDINGTALAKFSLVTSERWKDSSGEWKENAEWHNIEVWGKIAESVGKYYKKGQLVNVEGKIQTQKYQDQTGQDKYRTVIKVQGFNSTIMSLQKPEGQASTENPRYGTDPQPEVKVAENVEFVDEIPF